MQKPVNELGKSYVDFMRCNVDQLRQKITDELYTLAAFEVSGWLGLCLHVQHLHTVRSCVHAYRQHLQILLLLLLCVRQPPSSEQKTAQRFCCPFGGLQGCIKWYNKKKGIKKERK